MKRWTGRKLAWLGKFVLGAGLALAQSSGSLLAWDGPAKQSATVPVIAAPLPANEPGKVEPVLPASAFACDGRSACDPCAPLWCDPVSRVPHFFGDFFARGAQACQNATLTFSGAGAEGGGFETIETPVTVTGAGRSFILNDTIPINNFSFPTFSLGQNNELTQQLLALFPGIRFVNGGGEFPFDDDVTNLTFFYNYVQNNCFDMVNPAGGGLVGRNKYYDNGSPLPQDRVYFHYNRVGSYQGLGSGFDINRYVLGVEKTFADGDFSVEVRVPFAGTANSDQVAGQDLAVDDMEFGNIGIALKAVLHRTPNSVVSVGLGVSLPTADDSSLLIGNTPIIEIENRTVLLQPMIGAAWAPNDRFYAQAGLQLDFDPCGNPVKALNTGGGLSEIGVLTDQGYAFLSGAVGYWVYQNPNSRLTGIALQSELHYDRSFGSRDIVEEGDVHVSDLGSNINVLNDTTGAIFRFNENANLSVGVSFPIAGDQLYDWNVIAQFNVKFGGPR